MVSSRDPLTTDRLLTDTTCHLGQVQHGSTGSGLCHDNRGVTHTDVLCDDLSCVVTSLGEVLTDAHLEGLLDGTSGHCLEGSVTVGLNECVHSLDTLLGEAPDLILCLWGDVLVVDTGTESVVHDGTECDPGDTVDEHACAVRTVVTCDPVENLTLAVSDSLCIDGTADELSIDDLDECVVGTVLLLTAVPASLTDGCLEAAAEGLGQDCGEELLSGPVLVTVLIDHGCRDLDTCSEVVLDVFLDVSGLGVTVLEITAVQLGDDVHCLLAVEPGVLVGEEERTGDVVVDRTDDGTSVPGGQDVLLDLHDDTCLCTCLLALDDVEVHLVTVKVRVVRRTDTEVEPEGLSFHDPDTVGHHGHPVQRRLPVEQDDVSVHELPLDGESLFEVLREELGIVGGDPHLPLIGLDDVVDSGLVLSVSGPLLGTSPDHLTDDLDVGGVDMDGNGELPGCGDGHSDLVDGQHRVGRDDGTCGEVHTLTGQVGSETTLLTLEPLSQSLQRTSGPVPCGRDTGGLVVEVSGDVVLKEVPKILDDQQG